METYGNFQPTPLDSRENYIGDLPGDQSNWLVAPVFRNRDSNCLELSNFRVALESFGGEDCEDIELLRFNHWACGWYEIIIVRPDTLAARNAEGIESKLADYPILSEEDYSELVFETASNYWERLDIRERWEYIEKDGGLASGVSIFSIRHNYIPETRCGEIYNRVAGE